MCEGPVMAFDEVWWVCWVWWLGIYGIMTTGPDDCVIFLRFSSPVLRNRSTAARCAYSATFCNTCSRLLLWQNSITPTTVHPSMQELLQVLLRLIDGILAG